MLIGELAKLSGLSRDTIRFYEKQGLIQVGRKDRRFNNYKEYSEATLQKLHQIRRIKSFGFTLHEASELLIMIQANAASCERVAKKVSEKIVMIDQKITELQNLKAAMTTSVEICLEKYSSNDSSANCPILTSEPI